MEPIAQLMEEHQVILKVVAAAREEARRLAAGDGVNRQRVEAMVEFIRHFADACHHAKEEDLLFARMGERGFSPEVGPVAVMLFEHQQGRRLVQQVVDHLEAAAGGDPSARSQVAQGLTGWAELLEQHIYKEDHILYPMAQQALTGEDWQFLREEFARVEREHFGEAHQRYVALAEELSRPS